MKLRDYRESHGLRVGKLAAALDLSEDWVLRIERGTQQASPTLARKIEKATFGAVTCADLGVDLRPIEVLKELREAPHCGRAAVKRVTDRAGMTIESAENWLGGYGLPSTSSLARLREALTQLGYMEGTRG